MSGLKKIVILFPNCNAARLLGSRYKAINIVDKSDIYPS